MAAFTGAENAGELGQPLTGDHGGGGDDRGGGGGGCFAAACGCLAASVGGRGFKGDVVADPDAFLDRDPSARVRSRGGGGGGGLLNVASVTQRTQDSRGALSPFHGTAVERRDSDFSFTGSI